MRVEEVDEPIWKKQIIATKKVTKYITENGMAFSTEQDAIAYEAGFNYNKKLKAIKSKKVYNELFEYEQWYSPKNEEELETIKKELGLQNIALHCNLKVDGNVKPGEWISGYIEDGGDTWDTIHICTLTWLKQKMEEFLENFEDGDAYKSAPGEYEDWWQDDIA